MFCFPRGVRLKRSSKFDQPPPSAFSYVFTEDMGRRVYVSCLVFYEEVDSVKVREALIVLIFQKVEVNICVKPRIRV